LKVFTEWSIRCAR